MRSSSFGNRSEMDDASFLLQCPGLYLIGYGVAGNVFFPYVFCYEVFDRCL